MAGLSPPFQTPKQLIATVVSLIPMEMCYSMCKGHCFAHNLSIG